MRRRYQDGVRLLSRLKGITLVKNKTKADIMIRLSTINNEQGMALFIALMLVLMLSVVGLGIIKSSNDEISIAGNEMHEMKAFYAAEAGLDKAVAQIQTAYEASGTPPDTLPAGTLSVSCITIQYNTTQDTVVQKIITKGSLAGLNGSVTPYKITASAVDNNNGISITLEETFEVALVPIFQFSVFYETDLEIAPGPSMLLFGRVHSNNDIYLQSGNAIDIDSYLTAFGNTYHGRKPGGGSTSNGEVNIKGIDGNYYSMREAGGWLDANDSHWFDSAATRWGGRVQDAAFGQEKLNLPIDNPDNPYSIIDRDSVGGGNEDSYENMATFKIMDDTAWFHNGTAWVNVTDSLTADSSLKSTTFHDKREGQDITVYDIDMSIFKNSSFFPSNGIIYTADNRSGLRGTRIYDAGDIGHPLTIASENPVYTKGDVNKTNKQPMAIITDALMILSDNWSDDPAKTTSGNVSDRPAINTEINFSYITGNQETTVADGYNGGLENLPRFLETWSSKTLKIRGSIINLWLMQKVSGAVGCGSYYNPPTRDWAFDTDLNDPANMPPGTPTVRTFIRMGWRQSHVGYAFEDMN